jgi:hypothetical protein
LRNLIEEYSLLPTIEFMMTLKLKNVSREMWKNFAFQLVARYAGMTERIEWMK